MSSGRFLGGLIMGSAIGVFLGLLLAPRTGRETRAILSDEMALQINRSRDMLAEKSVEAVSKPVRNRVESIKHSVDDIKLSAEEKLQQLKAKSQAIADELEAAGRETLSRVKGNVKSLKLGDESPN